MKTYTLPYHSARENSSLYPAFFQACPQFFTPGQRYEMLCSVLSEDNAEESLDIDEVAKLALEAVLQGREEEALHIIANHPDCLLRRVTVKDYSGRTIQATPFQGALGAMDDMMYNKIMPYFEKITQLREQDRKYKAEGVREIARAEIRRQFDEQFPNDATIPSIYIAPGGDLKNYYIKLLNVIADGTREQRDHIIAEFRSLITQPKFIASGCHFKVQHLIAAYTCFAQHYDMLKAKHCQDVFSTKVLGYIQRQIPAHFAQAHCCETLFGRDRLNFQRSLKLKDKEGDFFPLEANSGLGYDFADIKLTLRLRGRPSVPSTEWISAFTHFCMSKQSAFDEFRLQLGLSEKPPSCVLV